MNTTETAALQPVWDAVLYYGEPYISHWLFAGWLTLVAYVLTCLYFTWKGVFVRADVFTAFWGGRRDVITRPTLRPVRYRSLPAREQDPEGLVAHTVGHV